MVVAKYFGLSPADIGAMSPAQIYQWADGIVAVERIMNPMPAEGAATAPAATPAKAEKGHTDLTDPRLTPKQRQQLWGAFVKGVPQKGRAQ